MCIHLGQLDTLDQLDALRRSCFNALFTPREIWFDRWVYVGLFRGSPRTVSCFYSRITTGHNRQKWISRISGRDDSQRLRHCKASLIDKIDRLIRGHKISWEKRETFHNRTTGERGFYLLDEKRSLLGRNEKIMFGASSRTPRNWKAFYTSRDFLGGGKLTAPISRGSLSRWKGWTGKERKREG